MKTTAEPSFELLARAGRRAHWLWWVLGFLVVANAGMGGWQYLLRQELAAAQLRRSQMPQLTTSPTSALSDEQVQALELLRTPVGAWLREIEHCLPEGAFAEQLQVDALNRKVILTALASPDVDVGDWLACLNDGSSQVVWALKQATRVAGGATSLKDGDLRLVLERRASSTK